jgi:Mrp family chromosome partitioning ATPase
VEGEARGSPAGRAGRGEALLSTLHKPADEETRERETLQLQQHMAEIKHKLLVLSGKGDVGKSTVPAGSTGGADALSSSQGIEVVKT